MSGKTALITGICGQDAAYMAKFLLEKGYNVVGVGRTLSEPRMFRLKELGIVGNIEMVAGDICDFDFLLNLFKKKLPEECYNFAAISFVGLSWKIIKNTMEVNATAVLNVLEAIRQQSPDTKLYQAGSSELFGRPKVNIQNEETPFLPCNPYGVSKLAAHNFVDIYRKAHNLFGSNAICYNHESPIRGIEYVTKKITNGVAKIKCGLEKELRLGNINSRRDWGYAPDYVDAMWRMLQQNEPQDFVLATGKTHSIKDFLGAAFAAVDIFDWEQYIVQDERFYRPLEPNLLCGDNSKAKKTLNWEPTKQFEQIVAEMVEFDLSKI